MKALKIADLLVQLSITAVTQSADDGLFYFLFVLGGWQVFSCILHAITARQVFTNFSRRAYTVVLLSIPFICWVLMFYMIHVGIAMAIWYFLTCLLETISIMRNAEQAL